MYMYPVGLLYSRDPLRLYNRQTQIEIDRRRSKLPCKQKLNVNEKKLDLDPKM